MSGGSTADTKFAPYWWEKAPPIAFPGDLPRSVDVVVVGSGITGLNAALPLLRSGRSVLIVDRDLIGSGAARRSAGYISRALKYSFRDLSAKFGEHAATSIYRESDGAVRNLWEQVEAEGIECFLEKGSRLVAFNSIPHKNRILDEFQTLREKIGYKYHVLEHSRVKEEIDSDRYCGALVATSLGSVHPGLYHQGVLDRVLEAGGEVRSGVEVLSVDQSSECVSIRSTSGTVRAEAAVLATNGYTTSSLGLVSNRLLPFTGFMAATEDLDSDLLQSLLPHRSTMVDARTNIDFFRPAPDAPRLIFGGGTGALTKSPGRIAARLRHVLDRVFPQLHGTRLSHVWTGQCAGTYDTMPHMGREGRIWYGLGYNFAGIAIGTHFGQMIAKQIMRDPSGESAFEQLPFRRIPFIGGCQWAAAPIVKYFDCKDDIIARST